MRRSLVRLAVVALAAGALVAASVGSADAKAVRTTRYPMAQVWPTAVRFLRVDEGLEIVDKDEAAGYVVFVHKRAEGGKPREFRGALELIATSDGDGKPQVRMVLTIDGRPEYTESGLLDRMLAKLAREHGDAPDPSDDDAEPPAPAPAPKKPAPAPKK